MVRLPLSIVKKLQPETLEQIASVDWVHAQHPYLVNYMMHIANERRCSKLFGYILRRLGLLKGASDLFIAWPTSKYYGLFIEVKSLKGKPTKEQIAFIKRMNEKGYFACFAYGADEVIQTIKNYLGD